MRSSVGYCVDCNDLLCEHCGIPCDGCSKLVCPKHVNETSHGRELCTGCWEERRARRKHREHREHVPSFQELAGTGAYKKADKGKQKDEEIDRTELLSVGAYKPPPKWAYALAFIFFGISGIIVLACVPQLRDMMWPFEATGPGFTEDAMAPIQDSNRLRDTSNVSNLNMFKDLPLFFVSWGIVVIYVGGAIAIFYGSGVETLRLYMARRKRKALEKLRKEHEKNVERAKS